MHATSQQEQPLAVQRPNTPWWAVRRRFVTLLMLVLVALNVATLINDGVHTAVYDGLKRVLGTMIAAELLDTLLSHSPISTRPTDIQKATARLRTEITQLKHSNEALDSANRSLKAKHEKLSADHDDLRSRHAKLDADHKNLAQQRTVLEKEHQALIKQNNDLAKVKADSELRTRTATQKLSGNVAKRSRNASARNIAGAAGEAIPFVGIPIVAGLLAWDVYDLCQNLKDLNEMNKTLGNELVDEKSVCGVHVPTPDELQAKINTNWQQGYKEAMAVLDSPIVIPTISWNQMKAPVCAVVSVPGIC